ncbi:MAG: hypothetical protein IPF52_16480 [Saprospiraceae bacterium]|nr:hypothetical protein [Saprospiraceae bacterium]
MSGCINSRQVGGSDMYPKATKMNKQMKYANDRKEVPYVAIIGEEEKTKQCHMLQKIWKQEFSR